MVGVRVRVRVRVEVRVGLGLGLGLGSGSGSRLGLGSNLLVTKVEGLAAVEAVNAVVRHDEGTHAHMREAERDRRVAGRARQHVANDEWPEEEVVAPLAAQLVSLG